jgi:hypothetical protein
MRPFVVWYVREKDARNHFAARGGELVHLVSLVHLVCLVFLVYVVRRTRKTRQTRAPNSRPGLAFLTRGKPVAATSEWSILWPYPDLKDAYAARD